MKRQTRFRLKIITEKQQELVENEPNAPTVKRFFILIKHDPLSFVFEQVRFINTKWAVPKQQYEIINTSGHRDCFEVAKYTDIIVKLLAAN